MRVGAAVAFAVVGALLSTALANGTQPSETYESAVSTDVPVAQFRFMDATGSSTIADSAGSYTATNSGVALGEVGPFNGSKSGYFSGSAYAALAGDPLAGRGSFTAEAWVDWSGQAARKQSIYGQPVFDFGSSASNYMYLTPAAMSSGHPLLFEIHSSVGKSAQVTGSTLPANTWEYVAVTETSSGTLTLYVNGKRVGETSGAAITPALLGSTSKNYLGKPQGSGEPSFEGDESNVAFYAKALSSERILAHYDGGEFPVNTEAPKISGEAKDEQKLSASPGTWTGLQPLSFVYQWESCNSSGVECAGISSAVSGSYALGHEEVGHTLKVKVTATNGVGEGTASSAATATIAGAPPADKVAPAITGQASEGASLSASTGEWTGSPATYTYQWLRCNKNGNGCSSIAGATSSSYVPSVEDVTQTLRVTVTATNSAGSASASSESTAIVMEAGCTDQYMGPNKGSWQIASHWSTDAVPGAGDVACVGRELSVEVKKDSYVVGGIVDKGGLGVTGGSLEVAGLACKVGIPDVASSATVDAVHGGGPCLAHSSVAELTVSGGVLNLDTELDVTSTLEISGYPTISGSGKLVTDSSTKGTIVSEKCVSHPPIDGPTLSAVTFRNEGTLMFGASGGAPDGAIAMENGASFQNAGTFYDDSYDPGCGEETTGYSIFGAGGAASSITNTGTWTIEESSGETTRINVDTTTSGTLNVPASNELYIPVAFAITGGTVNDAGLIDAAGTLQTSGVTTVNGPGHFLVPGGASGTLGRGCSDLVLSGLHFTNEGSLTQPEGAIGMGNGAQLENPGSFNDESVGCGFGGGNYSFYDAGGVPSQITTTGYFQGGSASGPVRIGVPFDLPAGTLTIPEGELELFSSLTVIGTPTINGPGELTLGTPGTGQIGTGRCSTHPTLNAVRFRNEGSLIFGASGGAPDGAIAMQNGASFQNAGTFNDDSYDPGCGEESTGYSINDAGGAAPSITNTSIWTIEEQSEVTRNNVNTTTSGTLNVPGSNQLDLGAAFAITGGTVNDTGLIDAQDTLATSGSATINGPGQLLIPTGATGTLGQGCSDLVLSGVRFTNEGSLTQPEGAIGMGNGAQLENPGSFNDQSVGCGLGGGDYSFYDAGGAASQITTTGYFQGASALGPVRIGVPFDLPAGTLTVPERELELFSSFTVTGTPTINGPGELTLGTSGTGQIGAGQCTAHPLLNDLTLLNEGTLTSGAPGGAPDGAIVMQNGTHIENGGTFNEDSYDPGCGDETTGYSIYEAGGAPPSISNAGTFNVEGGPEAIRTNVNATTSGTLNVPSANQLDLQAAFAITGGTVNDAGLIDSKDTLATSGNATINGPGHLLVPGGATGTLGQGCSDLVLSGLRFTSEGSLTDPEGAVGMANGAQLETSGSFDDQSVGCGFGGGNYSFYDAGGAASQITTTGSFQAGSFVGPVKIGVPFDLPAGMLTVPEDQLELFSSFTVTGTPTIKGPGELTLVPSASAQIGAGQCSNSPALRALTVLNEGALTVGALVMSEGTTILNQGTMYDTGCSLIDGGGAVPTIVNTGDFVMNSGATADVGVPFGNEGRVEATAGRLEFSGGGLPEYTGPEGLPQPQATGSWSNVPAGSIALTGGLFLFAGPVELGAVEEAGATVEQAPFDHDAVTIEGEAEEGQTLTANPGTWTGKATPSLTYQWQLCGGENEGEVEGGGCANIAGATGTTYPVQSAAVGHTLRVTVTGTNRLGSPASTSEATAVVRSHTIEGEESCLDPSADSSKKIEECGDKEFTMSGFSPLPRGGMESNYTMGAGRVVTFTTPPESFNAATATSAELEEYGIPTEPPSTSPGYAKWQEMVHNLPYEAPPEAVIETKLSNAPNSNTTDKATGNWSGYVDQANFQRYTQATGYLYSPKTVKQCKPEASMSMWVGLGGFFSKNLSQDGFNAAAGAKTYPAWWEVLPENESIIKNFSATPGAEFLAETKLVGKTNRHFYMYNFATKEHKSFFEPGISENDSSAADFITAERLTIEKNKKQFLTPLSQFSEVEAQGLSENQPLDSFPNYRVEMYRHGSLAQPTELEGGGEKFKDKWVKCGSLEEG